MMLFWRVYNENHGCKLQTLPPPLVAVIGLLFRPPLMHYDPRHLDSSHRLSLQADNPPCRRLFPVPRRGVGSR